MHTNMMTAFTYVVSRVADENFSEPEHLATMIGRLALGHTKKAGLIAGWGTHYTIGLLFAAVYIEFWETRQIRHSMKDGIILGALSGALAVLVWKTTFKIHPLPRWVDYTNYYLQLVPAHIVFAIFATITYRLTHLTSENTNDAAIDQ
jgi:hypothetical protein